MKTFNSFSKNKKYQVSKLRKVAVHGATGSIGVNTLEVIRQFPQNFKVEALSCKDSIEKLREQIVEFRPRLVCVESSNHARQLRESFDHQQFIPQIEFLWGLGGLKQISEDSEIDLVIAGIVGAIGLESTFAAVEAGKTVAIANKEPLVMAGELFIKTAKKTGSKLLPIDSEHNAIFQALHNEHTDNIARLVLTASGGPFRDLPLSDFEKINLADSLKHPNWKMGEKISVDSATMMNKGLETIEAHWLFNVPIEKINILMQRESIVHSMVEFIDGSYLAQMGLPDIRVPISYCLGWPKRLPLNIPRLDPFELKMLNFEPIDYERFPCLPLSIKAAKNGGGAPAVLNGANEKVVNSFLNEEIRFIDIYKILTSVMASLNETIKNNKKQSLGEIPNFLLKIKSLEDSIHADKWGREQASLVMENLR